MATMQYQGGLAKENARDIPYSLRRLTDFEPAEKSDRTESLVTEKQLRDDIFENIDMLFNSKAHASLEDLRGYEDVKDSVLGYGIEDFCGRQISAAAREELRDHILNRISVFEPRLDPDTITVDPVEAADMVSVVFRIGGDIRVKDLGGAIALIVKLDIETGNAELRWEN